MADFSRLYPPNLPPIVGRDDVDPPKGQFLSFTAVEDRLVEALLTCWRYPDRERGWQTLRSAWPEISRDVWAGDYDARGGDGTSAVLRPAAQTRAEISEMEEAFGWLDGVAPDDRKLIGLAIVQLAQGKREVSWIELMRKMGVKRGADGLRMRYSRAITMIAQAQSRRSPRLDVSMG
ncbi:DUF6362 family protein [Sphingomonas sp. 2SG]|uniref:DUF6362 family protein n=1 Tax=Sphingomonas sp. 2SG TaxID=2502201 RepID=UPI0020167577|nr:DUF6362 family protein [Sphingomonas sp. 2SG]